MARVAIIGEPLRIHGYGVPGAILFPAKDQAEAVRAWRELPDEVDVAVLTPRAARWLASEIARRPWVLPVLLAETLVSQTPAGGDGLAAGGALAGASAPAGDAPVGPEPATESLAEPGTLAGTEPLPEQGARAEPRVPPLAPGHGYEPPGTSYE